MSHQSEFEHFQQTQPIQMNQSSGMNESVAHTNGHSSSSSNAWGSAPFMSSEMAPVFCLFKCSECHISKSSAEDLEIHIKVEHLNWLPFHCTHCSACRASDNQMREHVHSHHKKTEYRYIYVDNPQAKRLLQGMIDRALSSAIQQMVTRRLAQMQNAAPSRKLNGLSSTVTNGSSNTAVAAKRQRLHDLIYRTISHDQENDLQRPSTSVSPDEISGFGQNDNHFSRNHDVSQESDLQNPTDDIPSRLSSLFNTHKVNQNDTLELDESEVSSSLLKTLEAASSMNNTSTDNNHGATTEEMLLKNVSSLFSVDFKSLDFQSVLNGNKPSTGMNGDSTKTTGGTTRRRNGASNSVQSASKKRVLGECVRCNKPVTAGARQMHLFYHLSKDENTFRFKCKFENCDVEHYRKDQMENHQSKIHGKIDHSMMIDRSVELYDRVQKLSMELLGTGEPDDRRRKRPAEEPADQDGPVSMVDNNSVFQTVFNNNDSASSETKPTVTQRTEETMECQLCKKQIITRTRGFHLLHHLNTDLGIVRYCCKICGYKHDRPQSVTQHGKKEHGNENCLEDSLANYTEEIKSLSKACFGLEQLFTKESRRKNRTYPRPTGSPAHSSDSGTGFDMVKMEKVDGDATDSADYNPHRLVVPKDSPSKRSQGSNGTPSNVGNSPAKRKITNRRFGIRKPKSRKQRAEMAKLREVSMRIGGAMYFKKRTSDPVLCAVCDTYVSNRLTHHAYSHLDNLELFLCPKCDVGHFDRNHVLKHLRDFHNCSVNPKDNRLKYAGDIKEKIRQCFPELFIDAPVPTLNEMEQLKKSLNLSDMQLVVDGDGLIEDENESHATDTYVESGDENDEQDENEQDDSIEPMEEALDEEPETHQTEDETTSKLIEDAEMVDA
ncbi:Zinc finger, C2H2 type [Aphelenchoides besseyi]|nr:Zinc finger, C2H2 type [Aphelenchoides besseyi]